MKCTGFTSRSLNNNDTNVCKYYRHHHQPPNIPLCKLVAVAVHQEAAINAHRTAPASPRGRDDFRPSQNTLDKQSRLGFWPYGGHLENKFEICTLQVSEGDHLWQGNFAHVLEFFFFFFASTSKGHLKNYFLKKRKREKKKSFWIALTHTSIQKTFQNSVNINYCTHHLHLQRSHSHPVPS